MLHDGNIVIAGESASESADDGAKGADRLSSRIWQDCSLLFQLFVYNRVRDRSCLFQHRTAAVRDGNSSKTKKDAVQRRSRLPDLQTSVTIMAVSRRKSERKVAFRPRKLILAERCFTKDTLTADHNN